MDRRLADEVASYARLLWERGWVANHDGNVSARAGKGRFLATPTAESKRRIEASMILGVDLDGKVHEGSRRLFGEWHLHAAAYRVRPDAAAVVHAHPPHATAAGLSGVDLSVPPLPEAVVSLGGIPTARAALPGPEAADAAAECLEAFDVVLLPGNGTLALGDDLEQAYLRTELADHVAHIAMLAAAQGSARRLPDDAVAALLEKRAKAGLGPEGRRRKGGGTPVTPSGPAAPGTDAARRVALARASSLSGDARVADEVARAVIARLGAGGK